MEENNTKDLVLGYTGTPACNCSEVKEGIICP